MPPKRRKVDKTHDVPPTPLQALKVMPIAQWGSSENPLNSDRGVCKFPAELTAEIFSYYDAIDSSVGVGYGHEPILPISYLGRLDTLRALSQTCVVYRRLFLPVLWETLDVCIAPRDGKMSFFKHAGETLCRKTKGLLENRDLAAMVRTVNVILTRYQTDVVLPLFTQCLQSLPNLWTIHVLHAHTQMTTAIKNAFEGVSLPSLRSLIIPGYCHELLKTCPNVRSVRCIRENGSKLVSVMVKHCLHVEEIRGLDTDEGIMKRLIKAAPNLRILELKADPSDGVLKLIPGFKKLTTIDIMHRPFYGPGEFNFQPSIIKLRPILKATPTKEKKYLSICRSRKDQPNYGRGFVDVGVD